MKLNISEKKHTKIGSVFTPSNWATFAIEQFGIFDFWMEGKSIFDPTMGDGQLLASLIDFGLKKGYSVEELPFNLLFGNELNDENYSNALRRFQSDYGLDLSEQFSNVDLFECPPRKYDVIFGNPPWQNYADLPEDYKPYIRTKFEAYGFTNDKRRLLLGSSRMDIATLVIQAVLADFWNKDGKAFFFLPLSIFLNDGANEVFRNFKTDEGNFALDVIYDFGDTPVFKGIATRNGLAAFTNGVKTNYPISYKVLDENQWNEKIADPLFSLNAPLSIREKSVTSINERLTPIAIDKVSKPRQGINTCGANAIFFFNSCTSLNDEYYLLDEKYTLPKAFIFPIANRQQFAHETVFKKWVLLPYTELGKPLKEEQIDEYPTLKDYLLSHESKLKNRKGVLIQSQVNKGNWWGLLGVGPYNFFPYKIIWDAYGSKEFAPRIVSGNEQANQSLQAYIPIKTKKEATRILKALQQPIVSEYLHSLHMQGTMNWAQPGKIKKLLVLKG